MARDRSLPPVAAAPAGGSRTLWLTLAALAIAVVAAHAPVLGAQAIALDDPSLVAHNPLVQAPGGESVRRFFVEVLRPSTLNAYYMPLSMTSLMLDVAAGGSATHQLPFHVTSLALQVVATLFLFLILRRLSGQLLAPALAALLYGVHPVMVEAIASAGERKTVLVTALAFASTWAYVRAAQTGSRRAHVGAVTLFALALLAKPSVLALPAVFVVLDLGPLARLRRETLMEKWPYVLLASASAVISALSVKYTWEFGEPPPLDLPAVLLKCAWLPAFYLKQCLWPVRLSTVYSPPEPFALAEPAVLIGVAVTLAVGAAAIVLRRRAPALLIGLAVFGLLLAPTFSIVRFSPVIAYDRYLHLPLLGIAFALMAGFAALLRRPGARVGVIVCVVVLAAAETAATRAALQPWRDSVAIWQRAVEVSPRSALAWNGLGATYSDREDDTRALAAFEAAVKADPGHSDAQQNLGRTLRRLGRVQEALPHLEQAARLAPGSASAAFQWGFALQAAGDPAGAEREFRRTLALSPDFALALSPLGLARIQQGDRTEGMAFMRRAIEATSDPGARVVLADLLLEQGDADGEARRLLEEVIARQPGFLPALNSLAWLLATRAAPTGDPARALALSERALALARGTDANVLDTRAAALASAGRFADAVAMAEQGLALAREQQDTALARSLVSRLARYRSRQPYVETRPRH